MTLSKPQEWRARVEEAYQTLEYRAGGSEETVGKRKTVDEFKLFLSYSNILKTRICIQFNCSEPRTGHSGKWNFCYNSSYGGS